MGYFEKTKGFKHFFHREAFKIFDRDRDGYIDMKELKRVTNMLGTMLTKEEVDEFMAEADRVRIASHSKDVFIVCWTFYHFVGSS